MMDMNIIFCFGLIISLFIFYKISISRDTTMSSVTFKNISHFPQTVLYKNDSHKILPKNEITILLPKKSRIDIITHHKDGSEEYRYILVGTDANTEINLTFDVKDTKILDDEIFLTNKAQYPIIFIEKTKNWTSDIVPPGESVKYNLPKMASTDIWQVIHPTDELHPIFVSESGLFKKEIVFTGTKLI